MIEEKDYSFPSDTSRIPSYVQDILIDLGKHSLWFTGEALYNVRVVLSELIANAVIHGNRNNPRKTVDIHMALGERRLEFHVFDKGKGFEMKKIPRQRLTRESCRGILICTNMCDNLETCFTRGKGHTVSVIFEKKKD
ncbi:MAG: ATP-binding protein [Clostridia bacterium]